MDDIFFRKMVFSDIEAVIALRRMQLSEESGKAIPDLKHELFNYYQKHLTDGSFVSWLAERDEEIIATSGMSFIEKPPYGSNPSGKIGILSSMYTKAPYRRHGIAKKLLGLVVEEARAYGCGAVQITASEAGALLYRDFGFVNEDHFYQYRLSK